MKQQHHRSPWLGSAVALLVAVSIPAVAAAQSPSAPPSPNGSSAPPSASAAPGPSSAPSPGTLPPPTVELTFDEPSEAWWTGRDEGERTTNADGGIRTVLRKADYSTWQWLDLPAATDVLRVEAMVFVEQGPGGGGPICGAAGRDDRFFWGGVNEAGEWLLGRIIGGRLQVEARGESPLPYEERTVGGSQSVIVTLECSIDPSGDGDRVALWIDGHAAGEIVDRRFGPFDKAGLVIAGDERGVTVFYDDLRAWDAAALAPQPAEPGASPSASPVPAPSMPGSPAPG